MKNEKLEKAPNGAFGKIRNQLRAMPNFNCGDCREATIMDWEYIPGCHNCEYAETISANAEMLNAYFIGETN